jgi:predicted ABC-type ATPase
MISGLPVIYVMGGSKGTGKTTFAREFLPGEVKRQRFLRADEIAHGLSPFSPGAAAVRAARILLDEIRRGLVRRETVAIESALSGKTYRRILEKALSIGYEVELHSLWLSGVRQDVARVRQRVRMGGHDVPEKDIRGRFSRRRIHVAQDYLPLATRWVLWDARFLPARPLDRKPS